MNKKKILLISAVFPPEPVVSASLSMDIALELSNNHEVTVFTPKPSRPLGYTHNQIKIDYPFKHIIANTYICPKSSFIGRLVESLSFGIASFKLIKKNNFDSVYINTWPLFAQILAVKAAKSKNIKTLVHIQDIYPESLINKLPFFKGFLNSLLLPLDKYVIRNSTNVVTISKGMSDYLFRTRKVSNNIIHIVYNWQDEIRFLNRDVNIHVKSNFTFMYLGSLSPSASIDTIINAFIKSDLHNARLVIAGAGSEKGKLVKIAKVSSKKIEFIDSPAERAGKIQSESDVLILSLKKGVGKYALPSKLSAYMFSAKPIIGSVDVESDIANVILESGCGWVCEPESVEKLSDLMSSVYNYDRGTLIEKGKRGFEYSLWNFTKNENLRKITALIESL